MTTDVSKPELSALLADVDRLLSLPMHTAHVRSQSRDQIAHEAPRLLRGLRDALKVALEEQRERDGLNTLLDLAKQTRDEAIARMAEAEAENARLRAEVEAMEKTRTMLISEAGMQEDQPSTLYDVAASVVYAAKRFQRQRDEMAAQLASAGEESARLRARVARLETALRADLEAVLAMWAPLADQRLKGAPDVLSGPAEVFVRCSRDVQAAMERAALAPEGAVERQQEDGR